jgi:hypothetical protein
LPGKLPERSRMMDARIGIALLAAAVMMTGFSLPGYGMSGDSVLVVVDREYAFSNAVLGDCPAYEISAEEVMVLVPEEIAIRTGFLRAGPSFGPERNPLWVTTTPLADDAARDAGVEVLFREGMNTVLTASPDAAYGLLARGYFIVEIDLRPLKTIRPAAWAEPLARALLDGRPLDEARRRFIESVVDSVDTLRFRPILHFLEYDDLNTRYRSRFQVRPEVRQQVVPYLTDKLDGFLEPYGGRVTWQEYVKKLGGSYACTPDIACDTIWVNVIGHKPGRKTSAYYVICAHYDAIASYQPGWSAQWYVDSVAAPGADDNGTGVTSVLECARLIAPLDLDVGVKFITFSGEEPGLIGSDYYVRHLAPDDSVIAVINFDMVGYVDEVPTLEIVYDWKSRWLSDQLAQVAASLDLESRTELVNLSGIADSDHASFWKMGIPGNMLIEELETTSTGKGGPVNPYYHTLGDTLGHLSMGLVGDAVKMVVGLIARYAEMPEDSLADIVLTNGSIEWNWDGRDINEPPLAGDTVSVKVRALNLGKSMDGPEAYSFEIWQGPRDTGSLIHESDVMLRLLRGEHTELTHSWRTDPADYGTTPFTFALLPLGQDVESYLDNNSVEVELDVLPLSVMLRNVHVTPNPVGAGGGERDSLRFEILHPEGDFNAVMDVWIYDITGRIVGHQMLERTPSRYEFGPGRNSVTLDRFVPGHMAPGLYICRARLTLLREPGVFDNTFKFAVDR